MGWELSDMAFAKLQEIHKTDSEFRKLERKRFGDVLLAALRENKQYIIFPKEPKHNWGTNER